MSTAIVKTEPTTIVGSEPEVGISLPGYNQKVFQAHLSTVFNDQEVAAVAKEAGKLQGLALAELRLRFDKNGKLDGYESCKTWTAVLQKLDIPESTARYQIRKALPHLGKTNPAGKHDGSKSPKRKAKPELVPAPESRTADEAAILSWINADPHNGGTEQQIARKCPGLTSRDVAYVTGLLEDLASERHIGAFKQAANRIGQYTRLAISHGAERIEPDDVKSRAPEIPVAKAETRTAGYYVIRRRSDGFFLLGDEDGGIRGFEGMPGCGQPGGIHDAFRFEQIEDDVIEDIREAIRRPRQREENVVVDPADYECVRIEATWVLTPVAQPKPSNDEPPAKKKGNNFDAFNAKRKAAREEYQRALDSGELVKYHNKEGQLCVGTPEQAARQDEGEG